MSARERERGELPSPTLAPVGPQGSAGAIVFTERRTPVRHAAAPISEMAVFAGVSPTHRDWTPHADLEVSAPPRSEIKAVVKNAD